MEAPEKKLVRSQRLNVRWSDLDANGHVNNSEIWTADSSPAKVAEGEAVMVWVNRKTGKPQPLPDFLRRLMPG
jgi:acyl-CoA thioesterase FadM